MTRSASRVESDRARNERHSGSRPDSRAASARARSVMEGLRAQSVESEVTGGCMSHARAVREYERIRREAWAEGTRVTGWEGKVT